MRTPPYLAARPYSQSDHAEWLRLRQALWPNPDPSAQLVDMDIWLARPDSAVLVVPRGGGTGAGLAGFAEVGTRSVADSCETSPVAYPEGGAWTTDPKACNLRALPVGRRHCQDTASPSSRGLGHRPFTAVTRVRISLGTPFNLMLTCVPQRNTSDVAGFSISAPESGPE